MQGQHITNLLEQTPFTKLSEIERSAIESHITDCPACLRAYEAAQLSAILVQARASEQVEPSPFFKTRLMAALKERYVSPEEPVFIRMWKAARGLVWAMTAVVFILVGVTFFIKSTEQDIDSAPMNSLEWVMYGQSDAPEESMTDDQVLATMYEAEDLYGY